MNHNEKRSIPCKRMTPIVSGNTSMAEGALLDRGFRETYLRCELPRGHGGPEHLTHLPDGTRYAFPRQPGEVWE